MPRLSAKTLEKRVLCQQCGQTFRNRAGLLGHIRFRHGKPGMKMGIRPRSEPDPEFVAKGLLILKTMPVDIPPEKLKEIHRALKNWIQVDLVITSFGLHPTYEDFKGYVSSNVGRILNHSA